MAHTTEQKIKLLILWDILCRYTDEEHALNTDEIRELLVEKNIHVARKVLAQDIELLNEYGYEVLSYKKKYLYYYVVHRVLDTAEISMLSDAVQATKLSAGYKELLTKKLASLCGRYHEENILQAACFGSMPKRNNGRIIYIVDALKQAIAENKKVSFLYYSLDYQKNRAYRNEGKRYVVDPLAVVWNKDNYYLVCHDNKHDGIAHYRVDRMDETEKEDTPRVKGKNIDMAKYLNGILSMFGGEEQTVILQFDAEILDEIYDKFGEGITVTKMDGQEYRISVPLQVSKTFFVWVAGTQGKVRIIYPLSVCAQFVEFVDKIKKAYL